MWSGVTSNIARSHLGPFGTVDTVCAMGTLPRNRTSISTTIQNSHTHRSARGLLCAQLLARMLDALTEPTIARHLAAHLVHAMNDCGVIAATERLADLDQLHLQ